MANTVRDVAIRSPAGNAIPHPPPTVTCQPSSHKLNNEKDSLVVPSITETYGLPRRDISQLSWNSSLKNRMPVSLPALASIASSEAVSRLYPDLRVVFRTHA